MALPFMSVFGMFPPKTGSSKTGASGSSSSSSSSSSPPAAGGGPGTGPVPGTVPSGPVPPDGLSSGAAWFGVVPVSAPPCGLPAPPPPRKNGHPTNGL